MGNTIGFIHFDHPANSAIAKALREIHPSLCAFLITDIEGVPGRGGYGIFEATPVSHMVSHSHPELTPRAFNYMPKAWWNGWDNKPLQLDPMDSRIKNVLLRACRPRWGSRTEREHLQEIADRNKAEKAVKEHDRDNEALDLAREVGVPMLKSIANEYNFTNDMA